MSEQKTADDFNGTNIFVEVVGSKKNWFIKVLRAVGPGASDIPKDSVLITKGCMGLPSPYRPRLRFTTRREVREAVRTYNSVNRHFGCYSYQIVGGLH
jgi:hypothetical protein